METTVKGSIAQLILKVPMNRRPGIWAKMEDGDGNMLCDLCSVNISISCDSPIITDIIVWLSPSIPNEQNQFHFIFPPDFLSGEEVFSSTCLLDSLGRDYADNVRSVELCKEEGKVRISFYGYPQIECEFN